MIGPLVKSLMNRRDYAIKRKSMATGVGVGLCYRVGIPTLCAQTSPQAYAVNVCMDFMHAFGGNSFATLYISER